MTNKRPNTIIIMIILFSQGIYLLGEGVIKWARSLLLGTMQPLKWSKLLNIWHWMAVGGPKNFWKFPRSIQLGRIVATVIHVIFYPKK